MPTTRLTRLTIFAIAGVTALSVAACGTSNNAGPTSSASPTGSAPTSSTPGASAKGKDWVSGLIASISGNAIQVTQQSGAATVEFTPSTKVTEVTPAQLTDVTAGRCVSVLPAREGDQAPGGAVTAQSVRVSAPVDGKCPQPKARAGAPTASAPPAAPSGPAEHRAVRGTVASVAGDTIIVTDTDANGNPSQITVTVTDKTKYTQQASTSTEAIAQGKCLTARGTKDAGGALQATMIHLQPADKGNCPQTGGKRHAG